MTKDQIKHMVDRFLIWRLPKPWKPDNGISYKRPNYAHAPAEHDWPVGTNLFDAEQAEAMVRYMIDGWAAPSPDAARLADELSALVEKATPAPWIADDFCMERDRAVRIGTTDGRDDYYLRSATVCECWTNHDDEEPIDQRGPRIGVIDAERNAKLIAWCRNNAPAIVKALREMGNG